jgi:Cu-Zn family superoxide dismutase
MRTSAFRLAVLLSVLGVVSFAMFGGCGSDSAVTTGMGGAGGTAGSGSGGSGGARTSISLTIASLGTSSATGTALFEKLASGEIKLTVMVSGAAPASAQHGIHIHQTGNCGDAAFKAAGPHFNPAGKQHGKLNAQGMHVGDLDNINVGADGKGKLRQTIKGATLAPGDTSLGGTSIVFHAGPDDMKTDPSGGSGDRIACGVIEQ